MLWRTHLAFGIMLATAVTVATNVENVVLFYLCTIIGALLPDVDHEGSKINRMIPMTRVFGYLFKHRGFFHSVFPVLIIYGIGYVAGFEQVGLYVGFGYLTHLLGDSLTVLGVNFLHPVWSVRARGFLRTGGVEETLLFLGTIAATVWLLSL